jgi:hypothetical protein
MRNMSRGPQAFSRYRQSRAKPLMAGARDTCSGALKSGDNAKQVVLVGVFDVDLNNVARL